MMKFTCKDVALAGLGKPMKKSGNELLYRCPRHDDEHRSLKINVQKDVWMCGPCSASGRAWALAAWIANVDPDDKEAVMKWLVDKGLVDEKKTKDRAKAQGNGKARKKETQTPVAAYEYTGCDDLKLARKLRFEPGLNGEKKSFLWEHYDEASDSWLGGLGDLKGQLPLYRLSEIKDELVIYAVEGEKDADNGAALGLATTTSGVNSWTSDNVACMAGKHVIIIADHDDEHNNFKGQRYAEETAEKLHGKAASVKVVLPAKGKDLTEWVETGATKDEVIKHCDEAPEWKPEGIAEVLQEVMDFIKNFVALSDDQAVACTLWAVHTHVIDASDYTPYLHVSSATKQCGKSRLVRDVLKNIVRNGRCTDNISPAALARLIGGANANQDPLTLIFDEADAQLGADKERSEAIRGILNSGFERSGVYTRCVGQGTEMDVVDFHTFGAKAISGIGSIADTVADRSIPIRLQRAKRRSVHKWRYRDHVKEAETLKTKLSAWAEKNIKALHHARPEMPEELSDRKQDICEPIVAIADLAGGPWPERARRAIVDLCAENQGAVQSLQEKLLADVKDVFESKKVTEMSSEELTKALVDKETSPWGEWRTGKGFTKWSLAKYLKPFGIAPGKIGTNRSRKNGYRLEQFQEAFEKYLQPVQLSLFDPNPPKLDAQTNTQTPANNHAGSEGVYSVSGSVPETDTGHAIAPVSECKTDIDTNRTPPSAAKNAASVQVSDLTAGKAAEVGKAKEEVAEVGAHEAIMALADYGCRFRIDGMYVEVEAPDMPEIDPFIRVLRKDSLGAYEIIRFSSLQEGIWYGFPGGEERRDALLHGRPAPYDDLPRKVQSIPAPFRIKWAFERNGSHYAPRAGAGSESILMTRIGCVM